MNSNEPNNPAFEKYGMAALDSDPEKEKDLTESFSTLAKALGENTKAQIQGNETILKQGNNNPGGGVFSLDLSIVMCK